MRLGYMTLERYKIERNDLIPFIIAIMGIALANLYGFAHFFDMIFNMFVVQFLDPFALFLVFVGNTLGMLIVKWVKEMGA